MIAGMSLGDHLPTVLDSLKHSRRTLALSCWLASAQPRQLPGAQLPLQALRLRQHYKVFASNAAVAWPSLYCKACLTAG